MADDWDLHAVVRGCTTTNSASSCSSSSSNYSSTFISSTSTTATTTTACGGENSIIMLPQQDENFLLIQDLYERNNGGSQELHDLYKPFFPKPSPPLSPQSIIPISSLSVLGGLQDLSQQIHRHNHHHQQQQQQQQQQQMMKPKQNLSMVGPYRAKTSNGSSQNQNSRSKRRKNQMKRVIEIPAEALSSDMWSWRKYGQKPIKGSPYPRGYYRCSTSKGCLARKQVERNRSDPGMFIVTYTAEHNHPMPTHRNSLAGSSRQKPTTSGGDPNKPSGSPLASSDSVSPEYEKLEIESCKDEMIEDEDEEENMSNNSPNLEDDFFDGLDELVGGITPPAAAAGAGISNTFSQDIQFPWFTNNATTTAAGGV